MIVGTIGDFVASASARARELGLLLRVVSERVHFKRDFNVEVSRLSMQI